jgi:hypothetical protein
MACTPFLDKMKGVNYFFGVKARELRRRTQKPLGRARD